MSLLSSEAVGIYARCVAALVDNLHVVIIS